jgi:spore germination protein Q
MNMSNGYGYKTQVSPAQTAPVQGYGYGYGGAYPYPMGGMQQPVTLPATMQAQAMPMQQMTMPPNVPSGAFVTPTGGTIVAAPSIEESYVENILRLNNGYLLHDV